MNYNFDVLFPDDELDCVLIATGALDEECCDVDSDVEAIETDDDEDSPYDETIPGMTVTVSMESLEADERNAAIKDILSENGVEDEIDSAFMGIDPDVEEIEDDDEDDE